VTRTFTLPLPQGYRRKQILDFYARDPRSVGERVEHDLLDKCILVGGLPALLEIRFEDNAAICQTDATDAAAARRAAVRMLGIDSAADEFENLFIGDPLLGALIERQRGLRIPLTPEPWEALAWAIMGQQINLKFAVMLRSNLIEASGNLHPCGLRAHPSAATVASLDVPSLRALKFSGSKA